MTPLIQLWERAQEVEDELAVIRKMMKAPLTNEVKRGLSDRVKHLEQEVKEIKCALRQRSTG